MLVRLDTSQEEAQLAAAQAQDDLARLNLDRMRGLRAKGITSQAELDRSAAEQQQATARVGEIRAAIEKKTIRAPFAGLPACARSTSASTSTAATRWCRCSRSTRST